MFVRRLGPACTQKNELDMQLTYREVFYDERLVGQVPAGGLGYVTLIGEDVRKIWTPDTFFRNSIESHVSGAIMPNSYARIYPDGYVKVSRRVELKTACPNLKANLLAGDGASCPLGIASYGYQVSDLEYTLSEDKVMIGRNTGAFWGGEPDGGGLGFYISYKDFTTERKEITTASGGNYMSILLNFNLGLEPRNG